MQRAPHPEEARRAVSKGGRQAACLRPMHRAVVPVATMLAIQVMISLSVLSLSVMMPVVAADLLIDPKLVGVFTAIIYGVAAVTALAAAEPIVRLGAVRICQTALLMAAVG